jgi:hypothetical protein
LLRALGVIGSLAGGAAKPAMTAAGPIVTGRVAHSLTGRLTCLIGRFISQFERFLSLFGRLGNLFFTVSRYQSITRSLPAVGVV